jgi:transposase
MATDALNVPFKVVAPERWFRSRPGDRVKTDRRDAVKLVRSYRAGDLTPVWVADADHQGLCVWCGKAKTPGRINTAHLSG